MVAAGRRTRRATHARPVVRSRALFALAALLVGDHFADPTPANDGAAVSTSIDREPDQSIPIVHALRQQPSARTRTIAFVVLAAALLAVASAPRRVVRPTPGALRTLRLGGRPPGRAPPRLHIA